MSIFTHHEIMLLFLSIALLLGLARGLGEIFNRIKLPAVIGQILAGIILGKSILGRISPDFYLWLFPTGNSVHTGLESFILLGVVLLLLTAGIEVDLSTVFKQGKSVVSLSFFSIMIPFGLGILAAWNFPHLFGQNENRAIISLFIGIAVSITALPIIARILMDMKLLHSDLGMLILSSAIINDLFGWVLFSVLVQIVQTGNVSAPSIIKTVMFTVFFSLGILTIGRYLINISLVWIQAKAEWPGGVISFAIITALGFSALAEAIGIHAIFGAFLAGIAIGDSPRLKEHTREIINQFINNIFAPLFFVSIGLRVDFINDFSLPLSLLFLLIVLVGKIGGGFFAGRITKMNIGESLAIGAGMSATGAMGIILGIFALEFSIINNETFVSIVITAVLTSILSGPLIKFFLKSQHEYHCIDLFESRLFIPDLKGETPVDVIRELSAVAARKLSIDEETLSQKVIERENLMSTGIGDDIAVPHARLSELKQPSMAVGISRKGIDFNSPDGKPSHIIFLILTPIDDQKSQIQILADISRVFSREAIRREIKASNTYTDFISAIKVASHTTAM